MPRRSAFRPRAERGDGVQRGTEPRRAFSCRAESHFGAKWPMYRGARATGGAAHMCAMTIDEISDNFSLLDEWDDRYRYIIELGRTLAPLPAEAHIDANKVQGCASQVWLTTTVRPGGSGGPELSFQGDSDAHIVRGLIAIVFALYSGKAARDILAIDPSALFERLGLREHLTPQRSNGLKSMVARIRAEAETALAAVN